MPRPPRIHHPGAIFHVMARGNGGQRVFLDEEDWSRFLEILATVKERNPFGLFAYCLMSNHFHLLVQVDRFRISLIMQHVMTRYARYFNHKRRRFGHVFQGRFEALLCFENAYLLELLRYIHLNPVRAGIVQQPEQWRWSGHHDFIGAAGTKLVDLDFPLSVFGGVPSEAVGRYLAFLGAKDALDLPQIVKEFGGKEEGENSPRTNGGEGGSRAETRLEDVAQAVCAESDVQIEEFRGASRRHSLAVVRRSFVLRSIAHGFRPSDIAAYINRSPSIVSRIIGLRAEVK